MALLTITDKRFLVASCYGDSWKEKVGKMSDSQVEALYSSFTRSGKITDEARVELAKLNKTADIMIKKLCSFAPKTFEELAKEREFDSGPK